MPVLRQQSDDGVEALKGPAARTRRLVVETASRMMREGASPSVSEVAEVAGVSRSTAYRYFPTQGAMVQAVVSEALGAILAWRSDRVGPEERVASLFAASFPRLLEHEATFRAALRQSLEPGDGLGGGRGHRVELLRRAIRGVDADFSEAQVTRLAQALSLTFGIESIVVLKDIWGLDDAEVQSVTAWAAQAMIRAALAELASEAESGPAS